MSGGFRDSFTKDDAKEDLLGYDDTAFYYFVISVLTCVAFPWTCSLIHGVVTFGNAQAESLFPSRNVTGRAYRYCLTSEMVAKVDLARGEARRCTARRAASWIAKISLLSMIWAGIVGMVFQLGNEMEIRQFDPFVILDVTPEATNTEIKRAYRKLSLSYHPDKNVDDPLAASRFIQITKAYQALTDEVARRNWEKYGNPDGPQTTKVGIGLPRFLLEKENNLLILCAFFFFLLFVVPVTFICYYQQAKHYAPNDVLVETLHFLNYYIRENTKTNNCPELLAACAESRAMATRPSDHAHVSKLAGHVTEHKKRVFTLPIIMKNQYLIWAHMQRCHHLMSPELRSDTDDLLRQSMKITQAMIEVACLREWFATAQAVIEFRRCLVQAQDVKSSELLQVPHFHADKDGNLERCEQKRVSSLLDFLSVGCDERRLLLRGMTPQQLADVEAFCAHIGEVELKAQVEVEDETEIVLGDVATVVVQVRRKHLHDDEAMGPVHAPLFPDVKFEEWWLFLVEAAPSTRIIHFERVLEMERVVEQRLRFQVVHQGENHLVLHALCDAYAGIDQKVELRFNAYGEDEFQRVYPSHAQDEQLDLQPTLFQQWVGLFNEDGEESDEDQEDQQKVSSPEPKIAGEDAMEEGDSSSESSA